MVLYSQFEDVDRHTRWLVTRAQQNRNWLIAQALEPNLSANPSLFSLNNALAKFLDKGTSLQLMFQPKAGDGSFYFVATAPRASPASTRPLLDSLGHQGILSRLSHTCSWDAPVDIRYRSDSGGEQILTSIIPIAGAAGCWVLVSSQNTAEFLDTAIGRSYWETRQVRLAAAAYLGMAMLAVFLALSVRQSMRNFRRIVHQMTDGRSETHSFSELNVIPELASVAADFDRLVFTLRDGARTIRESAENNAHSFKGPVATIQSSIETLKRNLPAEAAKAQRAADLIESSLERLRLLIAAAQRLDNNAADLLEASRLDLNLSLLMAELLLAYRAALSERGVFLALSVDDDVIVSAANNILQVAIENVLDNAVSFAPKGSTITVRLLKQTETADLFIEDEGPGIEEGVIERIFDRHVSVRPPHAVAPIATGPLHSGLGLWITRRNIEALDGNIIAVNRNGGGLVVHITLPLSRAEYY